MWILVGAGVVSLVTAFHLWTRKDRAVRRLIWTPIVALPVIGPLLYLGMYQPPSLLTGADRATPRDVVNDSLGAGH
jgi:hypothetical protein